MSLLSLSGVSSLSAPTKAQKDAAIYMFGSKGHSIVAVLEKFARAKEVLAPHLSGLLHLMKEGTDDEIIQFTGSALGRKTLDNAKQFAVAKTLTASIKALKLIRVPTKWLDGHSDVAATRIAETKAIRASRRAGNKPEAPIKMDNPHAPEAVIIDTAGNKDISPRDAKAFAAKLSSDLGMTFTFSRGDAMAENPINYVAKNSDEGSAVDEFVITAPYDGLPDDMRPARSTATKPKWEITMMYHNGKMRITNMGTSYNKAEAKRIIDFENKERVEVRSPLTKGKSPQALASLVETLTGPQLRKMGLLDKNAIFEGLATTIGKKMGQGYVVQPITGGIIMRPDDGNKGARVFIRMELDHWILASEGKGSSHQDMENLGHSFKISEMVKRVTAWLKSPVMKTQPAPRKEFGADAVKLVDELGSLNYRKVQAFNETKWEKYAEAIITVVRRNLTVLGTMEAHTLTFNMKGKARKLQLNSKGWVFIEGRRPPVVHGDTLDVSDLLEFLSKR